MERRQSSASKSIAHGGAAAGGGPVSGASKRKGNGVGRGGGGRKPIKVVYIDNPMRVTTSAADFRALVQELTGRNADPSKYSGAIYAGDDDSSGAGSLQTGALPSPGGSTDVSSDVAVAAAAVGHHVPAPAWEYDDDDSFPAQLIDNSYSVFSPPTFLYGPHSDMM